MGRPPAALGRAGQPGAHRRTPGLGPARRAGSRASPPGTSRRAGGGGRAAGSACGPDQEDVHSAVEDWLTRRLPGAGRAAAYRPLAQRPGRLRSPAPPQGPPPRAPRRRAGRWRTSSSPSPGKHQRVLWPGYTHQRRAMPSSVGLWAGAYAEGLLDTDRVAARPLGPGGSLAARKRRGLRRAASRFAARSPRGRSASPDSIATWRRCRAAGASSRPRRSSGAPSWGTSPRDWPRTSSSTAPKSSAIWCSRPTWPPGRASCRTSGIPISSS